MMTSHKSFHRRQRDKPETRVVQVRQEMEEMLERQSSRIAQLEACLADMLATTDELQAQFLKLRRDTLIVAGHSLAH